MLIETQVHHGKAHPIWAMTHNIGSCRPRSPCINCRQLDHQGVSFQPPIITVYLTSGSGLMSLVGFWRFLSPMGLLYFLNLISFIYVLVLNESCLHVPTQQRMFHLGGNRHIKVLPWGSSSIATTQNYYYHN